MNRNKMLCCPFHDDKTPSMQVYPKTDDLYCFSSNCEHGGKKIDVIDFIMHYEKITKAEAINKAKAMVSLTPPPSSTNQTKPPKMKTGLTLFLRCWGYIISQEKYPAIL